MTVCGPLAGVGTDVTSNGSSAVFLNLGVDFPSSDRFTVVVWGADSDDAMVSRLGDTLGTTVCASGTVDRYEGVPQIELDSIDDVAVPDSDEGPSPY